MNYKLILFDCFLWIHVFLRICFRKQVVVNEDKTAVLRSSIVKTAKKNWRFKQGGINSDIHTEVYMPPYSFQPKVLLLLLIVVARKVDIV